jgi:hypothetical protein
MESHECYSTTKCTSHHTLASCAEVRGQPDPVAQALKRTGYPDATSLVNNLEVTYIFFVIIICTELLHGVIKQSDIFLRPVLPYQLNVRLHQSLQPVNGRPHARRAVT